MALLPLFLSAVCSAMILVDFFNWLSSTKFTHKFTGCLYICVHAWCLSCSVVSKSLRLAHQMPLSMRLSWQEYWSKLPFPPPGDLPHPGMEPMSPVLASRSFTTEPPVKPLFMYLFVVLKGFPGSSTGKESLAGKECLAGKESACNAGDLCFILRSGISPGKGIGYPL